MLWWGGLLVWCMPACTHRPIAHGEEVSLVVLVLVDEALHRATDELELPGLHVVFHLNRCTVAPPPGCIVAGGRAQPDFVMVDSCCLQPSMPPAHFSALDLETH